MASLPMGYDGIRSGDSWRKESGTCPSFKELGLDISFQQLLGPTLTITKFAEQVCAKNGIEAV
jgi:hypothetical protein